MSKNKMIRIIVCLVIGIISNFLIINYINIGTPQESKPRVKITLSAEDADIMSFAFAGYEEEKSVAQNFVYSDVDKKSIAVFDIILKDEEFGLRLGSKVESITIYDAYYDVLFYKEHINLDTWCNAINDGSFNGVACKTTTDGIEISIDRDVYKDDFVWIPMNAENFNKKAAEGFKRDSLYLCIALCIFLDLIILKIIKNGDLYAELPRDVKAERKLIVTLAKNDFKSRFVGSYLGMIWAFVQPVVTVIVYWFVFQVGLKAGRQSDYPFILWLMAGLVPWFYFTEALSGGTNVLVEYNYLVKKVVFKINVLPIVKLLSAMVVHLFFVLFVVVMCAAYGYTPSIYTIQLVYYIFCTFVLLMGIVYLTSAVVVFFRDLAQIIQIVLQVGIWATPIMWNAPSMLSPKYVNILKLNPMYYIVDGFRDSLLDKQWFFDKGMWTIYFWIVSIAFILLGTSVFRKLKVHFADVL